MIIHQKLITTGCPPCLITPTLEISRGVKDITWWKMERFYSQLSWTFEEYLISTHNPVFMWAKI